jgi:hypothetical protein
MPLTLQWTDIGLRLLVALVAAAPISWDRGGHGGRVGIRTMLIACLASRPAMIASNLLLGTPGFDEIDGKMEGTEIALRRFAIEGLTDRRTLVLRVLWHDRHALAELPPALVMLARLPGVVALR